jgi:hypothetical protein
MSAEFVDMLPSEFRWPSGAFNEAHAAVESLYTADVGVLRSYITQFPEHHFGFESCLDRFERWHAAAKKHGSADVAAARDNARERLPAPSRTGRPASPLLGWVKHSHPLHSISLADVDLRLAIVYFSSGYPALRMDAYPTGAEPERNTLLSRIYVDLESDDHQVIEHYPGRYASVGLSPLLLKHLLHVAVDRKRRTAWDNPLAVEARDRARLKTASSLHGRAYQTLRESRAMQVAADPSGDPEQVFGAHLMPAGMAR